jgi:hypothetical protein
VFNSGIIVVKLEKNWISSTNKKSSVSISRIENQAPKLGTVPTPRVTLQ